MLFICLHAVFYFYQFNILFRWFAANIENLIIYTRYYLY